jgi:hypothetical protein
VRPRDLTEAASSGGGGQLQQPAAKRPRPVDNSSFHTPAKTLKKSPVSSSHDNLDDDDIQEVVPVVKSEPRESSASVVVQQQHHQAVTPMDDAYHQNSGGDGGGGGAGSGTVALEESYQDDGYDYEGYDDAGGYEDGGGGYDPTTGLPLASGGDGNKGRYNFFLKLCLFESFCRLLIFINIKKYIYICLKGVFLVEFLAVLWIRKNPKVFAGSEFRCLHQYRYRYCYLIKISILYNGRSNTCMRKKPIFTVARRFF